MNKPSESIKLFKFPLNIIIVDDDNDYLNLLQHKLKNTRLSAYNSPIKAITNITPISINIKDFLEEKFIGTQDLNYKNIETFLINSNNTQGILIVDYDMPEMTGIELFAKYNNNPNLIKILLTHAYTIEDAVNALNKKMINYYLPKDRINILLDVIEEQQNMLFDNLTKHIVNFLDTDSLSFLFEKTYINLFNMVCQQYNIKKYHILNSYGHYYLENDVDRFIFSIYNLTDLLEIAKEAPKSKKYDVAQGNLIPSYFSNEGSTEYTLIHAIKHGDYSYCIEKINL